MHRRRRREIHVGHPQRQHVAAGVLVPFDRIAAAAVDDGIEIECHGIDREARDEASAHRVSLPPRFPTPAAVTLKIATWNVNSLKVRLPQVLDWLAAQQPDVLCLQETKLEDKAFPFARNRGGRLPRRSITVRRPTTASPSWPASEASRGRARHSRLRRRAGARDRRHHRRCPHRLRLHPERPGGRLRQVRVQAALAARRSRPGSADELARHPRLALLGDYNIAPEDRDVHDPDAWRGQVLCSEPERDAFRALIGLGLRDAFRLFEQPEKIFSWWDYRMLGFQKQPGPAHRPHPALVRAGRRLHGLRHRPRAAQARAAVRPRAGRRGAAHMNADRSARRSTRCWPNLPPACAGTALAPGASR